MLIFHSAAKNAWRAALNVHAREDRRLLLMYMISFPFIALLLPNGSIRNCLFTIPALFQHNNDGLSLEIYRLIEYAVRQALSMLLSGIFKANNRNEYSFLWKAELDRNK